MTRNSHMTLIEDENGNPAPDRDKRDVPLHIMAQYMGIHPNTLYKHLIAGQFPKAATTAHGNRTYYRPWLWVREREAVRS